MDSNGKFDVLTIDNSPIVVSLLLLIRSLYRLGSISPHSLLHNPGDVCVARDSLSIGQIWTGLISFIHVLRPGGVDCLRRYLGNLLAFFIRPLYGFILNW